jgi:hypothetical protein
MKTNYPFLEGLASSGFLVGMIAITISTIGAAVRDQPVYLWLRSMLPYSPALLIEAGLVTTSLVARRSHKKEQKDHQHPPGT